MGDRNRSIRTEGIVLRRRDFGESDRILALFTRKLGRISGIAKGARKPSSKMAGHLELFMRSSFLISRGRNLHLITQAEALDSFDHLRSDLYGISLGSYVVELVDAVTYEEDSNLKLYDLLIETLQALDGGLDPAVIVHYFELHLLGLTGFRPELFQCVECGKKILEQDQYLSGGSGGVVCPDCGSRVGGADLQPVSARVLKYLRHFQRSNLAELHHLKVSEDLKQGLQDAIQYYLNQILEKSLNCPDFIKRFLA